MIRDEKENAMYGAGPWERVYLFAIGHGTDPKWNPVKAKREVAKIAGVLNTCDGLQGVHPVWPNTLAVFDTLNNAKVARNRLEADGHKCGTYIMKGRLNKAKGHLEVLDKAEE